MSMDRERNKEDLTVLPTEAFWAVLENLFTAGYASGEAKMGLQESWKQYQRTLYNSAKDWQAPKDETDPK